MGTGSMEKVKSIKGFTLLELIVAVGLLGLLAVSATSLFFATIQGGGKVDVNIRVKQNGQAALNSIEQIVRNGREVSNCEVGPVDLLSLVARDGQQVTFTCTDIGEETGHIAINSDRLTSSDVTVTACEFSCSQDTGGLRGDLVSVDFTLRQQGTQGSVSESASANFSTSVSLRSF